MNSLTAASQATSWRVDWAWSLPLIVATIVIHVFGLGLLHERVVDGVSRIIARRYFTAMFAAVMGIAVVLVATLTQSRPGCGPVPIGCSERFPILRRPFCFPSAQ
jgi:hypothetical protein